MQAFWCSSVLHISLWGLNICQTLAVREHEDGIYRFLYDIPGGVSVPVEAINYLSPGTQSSPACTGEPWPLFLTFTLDKLCSWTAGNQQQCEKIGVGWGHLIVVWGEGMSGRVPPPLAPLSAFGSSSLLAPAPLHPSTLIVLTCLFPHVLSTCSTPWGNKNTMWLWKIASYF